MGVGQKRSWGGRIGIELGWKWEVGWKRKLYLIKLTKNTINNYVRRIQRVALPNLFFCTTYAPFDGDCRIGFDFGLVRVLFAFFLLEGLQDFEEDVVALLSWVRGFIDW